MNRDNVTADNSVPKTSSLKQRVLRAGIWTLGGYALAQVLRFGSSLIMTRLLAPDMFGVMAVATILLVILGLLSDIGIHQSIVQSPRGDDPLFLDTAWTVSIIRGFLLWILSLVLSAVLYFANAYGMFPPHSVYTSPVLPFVLAVIGFSSVVTGFQSTKLHTAYRSFDQKQRIKIELASQLVSLAVMITIGTLTRSIWALVAGGVVSSLTSTILSHTWIKGHRNSYRSDKAALKELAHFGVWVFVSSAIGVLASKGDRLLLGVFVDAEKLGLFSIAVLIVGVAQGVLSQLFTTVSLPAFSEIARNEPSRLREVYYKLRVPGDLALLFMMGFLITAGQFLIDLLYDHRYADAGGMLRIMAITLFSFRYGVAMQTYLAVGLPRYQAIINIVRFVSLYLFVPAMYYMFGAEGAIWGVALNEMITIPFVYYFSGKLRLNDFKREFAVLLALPVGLLCGYLFQLLQLFHR